MRTRHATAIALAALVAGCTLQHVADIQTSFPPDVTTQIQCVTYEGELASVAGDVRRMEQEGWRPKLVGYEHKYLIWGFWLKSKTVVCYERARHVPPAKDPPPPPATESEPADATEPPPTTSVEG